MRSGRGSLRVTDCRSFVAGSEREVSWPTLGFLVADWVAAHCVVPDGFDMGAPFDLSGWQLWATVNHYRVKPGAVFGELAPAFHYRRSQVIHVQKSGKGPWCAADATAQALGPVVFAGWAVGGEVYDCRNHGCGCGFRYVFESGDPMGRAWPTPLVQITAYSEDQTDNIFRPLQSMVKNGPLVERMRVGEEFIRVGSTGRIDVTTSKAQSRLGNPITAVYQDETAEWFTSNKMIRVAETQRRGLAGMGGRAIETSNAWDQSQDSVAQRSFESKAADVFRFMPQPPKRLSFGNKRERRKIFRVMYAESPWVQVDAIEAEAAELMERDPSQAERYFANRVEDVSDAFFDSKVYESAVVESAVPPEGATVALGFDGSQYDDWTVIRGRWVRDGEPLVGFTPTFAGDDSATLWDPSRFGGEVPRGEVQAAVEELMGRFNVARMYLDPELWQSEIDAWAARYGEKRVVSWPTYRTRQMSRALERLRTDLATGAVLMDECATTRAHFRNARSVRRSGGIVVGKSAPTQKIDAAVADALAHEAACDAVAAGETKPRRPVGMTVFA